MVDIRIQESLLFLENCYDVTYPFVYLLVQLTDLLQLLQRRTLPLPPFAFQPKPLLSAPPTHHPTLIRH